MPQEIIKDHCFLVQRAGVIGIDKLIFIFQKQSVKNIVMKNAMVVFLLLVVTVTFAQKSIKLKVVYTPDHQYNLESKNVSNMIIDTQVDDATKEQLKASGMSFPMKINMDQDMSVLMKTGLINEKKEVPVMIEYTKYDVKQMMGEKEMPSPGNVLKGMKASGWADSNGKLHLESVEGEAVTDEIRKLMMSMVDQLGTQIAFPEKPIKAGDEFTQEVPFAMPIQGGIELKMIIKTVYKLISFNSENALFDTIVTMTMDISMDKGSMTAEGAGKGKMIFDIKKSFMATYDSNIDMTMKMKMGPMDMDIKSTTESTMKVTQL